MSASTWTPPRVRSIILVFLAFIAANAFDCWATFRTLTFDGYEANGIVRLALDCGPRFFVAWKMTAALLLAGLMAVTARTHRGSWWMLRAITVAFVVIALYYLFCFAYIASLASR